jgi:two-component system LytT family response regulator
MIKAIIIDDETKGRNALKQKLTDYCEDISIVGEAAGGEEGIKLIEAHHPDIVFLDIEMPYMNGFEMLKHLQNMNFQLVFTTAYDQYAIKAIKFAAFDYLLKPVDIEELKTTIARLKDAMPVNNTAKKLEALEQNLQPLTAFNKIAIPTLEGLLFFNIADIINLEAQSNYTVIYFRDHPKLTASRTLEEFEDLLPANMFFRTHHSHLVNLNYIKKYIKGDGGMVELENGRIAGISRSKKVEFLQVISGHV